MRLFAMMLKRRLLSEISGRVSDLSEAQLEGWLRGHISLMDEAIDRWGDMLLEHRPLALEVLDILEVDELRHRLRESRPELAACWDSKDFERAYKREVQQLLLFLGTLPGAGRDREQDEEVVDGAGPGFLEDGL